MAKKSSTKISKIAMEKHIGSEPKEGDDLSNSKIKLIQCFYQYSYFNTRQDSFNYLLSYMKNVDKDKYKSIKKLSYMDIMTTDGWIARLLSRNCILSDKVLKGFNDRINLLVEKSKDVVVKVEKKTSNDDVLVSTKETPSTITLSEIDDEEDKFINEFKSNFNIKNYFMTNNTAQTTMKAVLERYKDRLADIMNVEKDEQLYECYSCYSPAEKKAIIKFFSSIVDSCETSLNNKKRTRKARSKSNKSNEQLVKKLNFKERDPQTGIESIKAENIIKKDVLALYDIKSRKITLYVGNDFSISGKTLKNYDPEKSFTKTLRKPDKDLPILAKSNKRSIQKNFNNLTTKGQSVTGRLNDNMIILFVA